MSQINFKYPPVKVMVWGDIACFTNPEFKVERRSYTCMTPSAARGILESIFWKPEFNWIIRSIEILNPIKYISIKRNEVKSKLSLYNIKKYIKGSKEVDYDVSKDRTQRYTIALKDVKYIISANISLKDYAKNYHPVKYRDQIQRRVKRGQCYKRPFLGNKEFAAFFTNPPENYTRIDLTKDIGKMLFDLNYKEDNYKAVPYFFDAKIENGILKIPYEKYKEVW